MLDVVIRSLAHILTPLFFIGMIGATLIVLLTLGSDVAVFFEDDVEDIAVDPPR